MSRADTARAALGEARSIADVLRHEVSPAMAGPVVVSGVLADQLAKELGAGAQPGSVLVSAGAPRHAEALVRVVAGTPTDDDEAVVSAADRADVPVVLVQLWPQAEWTRPFVLTPFVVECRAGEGFPVEEIGDRIVEASGRDVGLAVRLPVLRACVERSIVRRTIVRAAALGALPRRGVRPLITLDQIRMVAQLASLDGPPARDTAAAAVSIGGPAGLVVASGLALAGVARTARRVLPTPLANGLVAGAGTWAIARAVRTLGARARPSR